MTSDILEEITADILENKIIYIRVKQKTVCIVKHIYTYEDIEDI